MDNPATPFSEPPSVDDPRRLVEGWVLLWLVFGFWLLSALIGYFNPNAGGAEASGERGGAVADQQVKVALLMGQLQNSADKIPVTGAAKSGMETLKQEAVADAEQNAASARQALTLAYEVGDEMPEAALKKLSTSESARDKAFLQLYTEEKLTPDLAAKLGKQVGGKGFLDRLAASHAEYKAGRPEPRRGLMDFRAMAIVGGLGALFFVAGGLLLVSGLVTHFHGAWPTRGFFSYFDAFDADSQAFRMALYMVAFIGLGFLYGALVPDVGIWGDVGFMAFTAVLIALLYRMPLGGPETLKASLGRGGGGFRLVLLGIGGFMANLPIFALMAVIIAPLIPHLPEPSHPINEMLSASPSPMTLVGLYVTAAVFAPLLEELTFRGMLFPALKQKLGSPGWAMVIQALMFAAVHPQGPLLWPMLGLVGFTSAFLAHKTGSLIPGLVLHAVHNAFILTLGLTFA